MDDGPNTYAYVGGNPLIYADPTGEYAQLAWCFGGPIGCAAGVGSALLAAYLLSNSSSAVNSQSNTQGFTGMSGSGGGTAGGDPCSLFPALCPPSSMQPQQCPASQIHAKFGHGFYRQTPHTSAGFQSSMGHIMARHRFNSSVSGVSQFNQGMTRNQIKGLINSALRNGTATPNGPNAWSVTHNFNTSIGFTRNGGSSYAIKIYVRNGIIKTAFPI